MSDKERWPEDMACETREIDGVQCHLVKHRRQEHYCGYAVFPKRLCKETGYKGVLTYVPVHGGITFANEREDGSMVYGFDCAHNCSPDFPCDDFKWLFGQCAVMVKGIKAMSEIEDEYLLAEGDNEKRGTLLDKVRDELDSNGEGFNTGAALNLMGGQL